MNNNIYPDNFLGKSFESWHELTAGIRTAKQLNSCKEYQLIRKLIKLKNFHVLEQENEQRAKNSSTIKHTIKIVEYDKQSSSLHNDCTPYYTIGVCGSSLKDEEDYAKQYGYSLSGLYHQSSTGRLDNILINFVSDTKLLLVGLENIDLHTYAAVMSACKNVLLLFEFIRRDLRSHEVLPKKYKVTLKYALFTNNFDGINASSADSALSRVIKSYFKGFKIASITKYDTEPTVKEGQASVTVHRYGNDRFKHDYYYNVTLVKR